MLVQLFILIFVYLLGCLPGTDYALKKINKSKKNILFTLDNGAMVSRYREFREFWICLGFEASKWLIFWIILSGMDFFLFLVFILGTALPFWNKFKPRNLTVYFLLYLIWVNIIWSIVFLILYTLLLLVTKNRYRYVNLLIVLPAAILFGIIQLDAIYLQEILVFFFFILVDVIAGYLSKFGKKPEAVTK